MSAGGNIADVIRTALVGGTVAFLGYLGYNLIQLRINNPPPRVVTLEGEELGAVRDELKLFHEEIGALEARHRELAEQHESNIQPNLAPELGLSTNTRIEYGTVLLKVGKGTNKDAVQIAFRHEYKANPTVVCTDNGTRGTFTYVRVSSITRTGCSLGVLKAGNWVDGFTTPVGYMVIGEVE